MKRSSEKVRDLVIVLVYVFLVTWSGLIPCAAQGLVQGVQIQAPDGVSTQIYAAPATDGEVITSFLEGTILEVVGRQGEFYEVKIPGGDGKTGFILVDHTIPFIQEQESGGLSVTVIAVGVLVVVAALAVGGFIAYRTKASKAVEGVGAAISGSAKRAEELFKEGHYADAVPEFLNYLDLQPAAGRNPDICRRMAICYQRTGQYQEAAKWWEKMRASGGLRGMEDYTLGVELMRALGKESEAANIYEHLLTEESDPEKVYEIHKKLYETYRRNRDPEKLTAHALELISDGPDSDAILTDTINFLIAEGRTDVAVRVNSKPILQGICKEFLDEKNKSEEARDVYQKCLAWSPKDTQLHKILAESYRQSGDIRKAVGELTILHTLTKDGSNDYIEEAAKIYIENTMVQEALSEASPLIIKEMAKHYLARSEVHPDAVLVYERVLESHPKAVGVTKMLKTVYLTRGDLERYMETLRRLHEIDGRNEDYLGELARAVIDNNLIEETLKEGNRELNAKILQRLIKAEAYDDAAIALYRKLLKSDPDSSRLRRALAKAYKKREEPGHELEHVLALSNLEPDDDAAAERAANLAVEHSFLEHMVKAGRGKALVLTALGLAAKKSTGPYVRQVLEKALEVNPRESRIRDYLSRIPEDLGGPGLTQATTVAPRGSRKLGTKTASTDVRTVTTDTVNRGSERQRKKAPRQQTRTVRRPTSGEVQEVRSTANQTSGNQMTNVTEMLNAGGAHKSTTTFVSASAQHFEIDESQLYKPNEGGLAYQPLEVLWNDGWSDWCRGIEVNTSRNVLIRVFDSKLLDRELMGQFVQQVADVTFNMAHDNILGIDEIVTNQRGGFAFTHPYLPRNLDYFLSPGARPDFDTIMLYAHQLVSAMAYAHHFKGLDGKIRRIYHLHLQASQVLVDEEAQVCKIAGLGYSQIYRNLTQARKPRWQDPGMSPAYMPPEFFLSARGSTFERAADVYSLGVLLYYLVAGEFPFEGPAFDDFKFQHAKVFPPPPRLANPEVPDWIEPLILACMEKSHDQRPKSVAEIEEAFRKELG